MTAPKLTEAQRVALSWLATAEQEVLGYRAAAYRELEAKGLAFQTGRTRDGSHNWFSYSITDAGRAALRGEP